jgi:indole-3-acetate monooxygenase
MPNMQLWVLTASTRRKHCTERTLSINSVVMSLETNLLAITPLIEANIANMQNQRRMSPEVAATLAQTGAFQMLVPRDVGGLEYTPLEIVQSIESLAKIDASVAWCVMIGATSALYSAYLPTDLAQTIYGARLTITGGVFAPMGSAVLEDDHYIVNGHWRWASGSQNCTWLSGGCIVMENGVPTQRAMIFPAKDVELIDTWHTMGLRGTGSGDMKVTNLRIPKERSVSLMTDKPHAKGALYAFPAFGLLAMGIASVACGNAMAALAEFKQEGATLKTGGARKSLSERATVQTEFAQATAELKSARAFMIDELSKSWETARSLGQISLEQRVGLRLAATHLTRVSADVCRRIHDLSGGVAVFSGNKLERRLRDAQTMTAHMMIAAPTYELTGKILLGISTNEPLC